MENNLWERITLREIGAGDETLIDAFFDAMSSESRALFNRRDYNRRGVKKFCSRPDPTHRYWMAELDGEMAAYVFFGDWNTSIPTLGIAVRDDLRGQHLGRSLIAFAQDTARSAGKGGIFLTTHTANLRAQVLYENMGFTCMGLYKNGAELFYLYRYPEQ